MTEFEFAIFEENIRAKERAKVLDEVWRVFCKYEKDINDANYGFNFVEIAFNEVKNKYKATNTCEWIKYDYRTMCPKNHNDVDNPYWRIPVDMKHLRYCPYCGMRISLSEE